MLCSHYSVNNGQLTSEHIFLPFNYPKIEYNGCIKDQLISDHHIFSNLQLLSSSNQSAYQTECIFSFVSWWFEIFEQTNNSGQFCFIFSCFKSFFSFFFLQSIGNRLMLHQAAEATTNEGEILSDFTEHRYSGAQN